MRLREIAGMCCLLAVTACAPQQAADSFISSTKPANELRAMQTRVVDADRETTARGVVATLQDLGYRITRADADAGTISATRLTGLRLAATIETRGRNQTMVRANASVVGVGRETQVDDPNFYQANFFVPLGNTMARNLMEAPPDGSGPAAPRPAAERLPGQRQAPAASGEPPPARP
jgi:hypothetical protein